MKIEEFEKEAEKVIEILDQKFSDKQRYDISSRMYLADVFEDFEFIKNNIDNNRDLKILDIGCGKGHLTALLSVFLEKRIEAVDLLESFGEGGKYNVETLGAKWQEEMWDDFRHKYNVDYKFYDGKKLPFEDDSFDVLVAYAVLEHVEDEDFFLQECRRVLNKGGKLFIFRCPTKLSLTENIAAILKMPHHDRRYSASRMKKLFSRGNYIVKSMARYDTFPAFMPIEKYQNVWNAMFPFFNFFRKALQIFPFSILAHHFRLVAEKKIIN